MRTINQSEEREIAQRKILIQMAISKSCTKNIIVELSWHLLILPLDVSVATRKNVRRKKSLILKNSNPDTEIKTKFSSFGRKIQSVELNLIKITFVVL
jgi:hypothetical protein